MNYYFFKKKGFTLIELLVVVAILGALATIGVYGLNGYLESAKKTSTKENYQQLTSFMKTQLAKCKLNGDLSLMSNSNNQNYNNISCSLGTGRITPYFINHMKNIGFVNPYNKNQPAIVCCGNPYVAGQTYVGVGGNNPSDPRASWWFSTKIDNNSNNNIFGQLKRF
jgi:prepilin-type N-terminal cleavage/methylation domain-containing protein